MTKIYLLSEITYLYNDETYYTEEDMSRPIGAYTDRKEAEDACLLLTIKQARDLAESGDLFGYSDRYSFIDQEISLEVFGEIIDDRWESPAILDSASDESILELLKDMHIVFYEVREIELHSKKSKTRKNSSKSVGTANS